MELEFEEVVLAYFDCRKGKRRSLHALDFEFDLERQLYLLYEDLQSGHYQIGRSIVFVVEQPKIREIWSATFRDRIVHHISCLSKIHMSKKPILSSRYSL